MDSVPPINIIGVYLEPRITPDVAEATKKLLIYKVQKRVELGENYVIVGDMKTAVNPDCKKINPLQTSLFRGTRVHCTCRLTGQNVISAGNFDTI